ncbi:hypothetical protein C8J56DRAFT_879786 [Mycena floridula]|nr:hypothetical protein C8J56DRAFT_879786 [Mycena floridula]
MKPISGIRSVGKGVDGLVALILLVKMMATGKYLSTLFSQKAVELSEMRDFEPNLGFPLFCDARHAPHNPKSSQINSITLTWPSVASSPSTMPIQAAIQETYLMVVRKMSIHGFLGIQELVILTSNVRATRPSTPFPTERIPDMGFMTQPGRVGTVNTKNKFRFTRPSVEISMRVWSIKVWPLTEKVWKSTLQGSEFQFGRPRKDIYIVLEAVVLVRGGTQIDLTAFLLRQLTLKLYLVMQLAVLASCWPQSLTAQAANQDQYHPDEGHSMIHQQEAR